MDNEISTNYVVLSKFTISNGMEKEVKEAFVKRPHFVDSAQGFIKMDVISPIENLSEIWLITYWKKEEDYKSWHHSHLYKDSHKGMPKGLKLVPGNTKITFFEHISS